MTDHEIKRRKDCETIAKELNRISYQPESLLYGMAGKLLKNYKYEFIVKNLARLLDGKMNKKDLARIVFGMMKNTEIKECDIDIDIPLLRMDV